MIKRLQFITALVFCSFALFAQGVNVRGIIRDAQDNSPQAGVTIFIVRTLDSLKTGAISDSAGVFVIRNVQPGAYKLTTAFLSYLPTEQELNIDTADIDLSSVYISQDANLLKEVLVKEKQIRVQQLGDTTQFNAEAYKTNPNANVEDLVSKMPGITVENGVVKVQGEDLKKVTIDGEDFFGDDATLALRNLPAEIVDKIQVFDRLSEQAQFTGFDDGNAQKTLNIVTKSGKSNGRFGKIYAGYGSDERFIAGANVNYFKGRRRISLIGLSNNINQQNFSTQDLLGITGSSGGGNGGGRRGGGSGGGSGGRQQGGAGANNFLVGQQAGISSVNSIGLNYTDRWGEKTRINASYFFNNNNNDRNSELTREYFLNESGNQYYDETNNARSENFNHRLNLRLEYAIDSSNSLSFRPQIGIQENSRRSDFLGQNYFTPNDPLTVTQNASDSDNMGYSFSGDLLYRHRFGKRGRTVSLNVGTTANDKSGEAYQFAQTRYFTGIDTTQTLDQQTISASDGFSLAPNLAYTEPIGKKGQIQINYSPSFNRSSSDRSTNNLDTLSGEYSLPEFLLSSRFDNRVNTHRGGVSYNLRTEKVNFSVGLNFQHVHLISEQTFPSAFSLDEKFRNVLPNVNFNYRASKAENLRIQYRSSTSVPSIGQLQNVLDNSNPLLLSIGNPLLKQPYGHSLTLRFNKSNAQKASNFLAYGYIGSTENYIANSTFIALQDTVVLDNIPLPAGAQLTRPVNLDDYWNARSFFTFGFPVGLLKSNLNLNTGFSYLHSPGLVNDAENFVNTYTTNAGLVLSSNISERLDFTLSYSANFNVVQNSLQPQLNNNFFFHNSGVKLSWEPLKRLTFSSDLTQTLYSGLGQGFNQQYWLLNATLGYRLLKNEALELRVGVFDILNQNNSVGRSVTETYVEDSETNVLRRYVMVTAVYSLRNFGGR